VSKGSEMFKLFFIYPIVLLIAFWLSSDVKIGASLYEFKDNYIEIEFPKKNFRSEDNSDPWYTIHWNATSAQNDLQKINDAISL